MPAIRIVAESRESLLNLGHERSTIDRMFLLSERCWLIIVTVVVLSDLKRHAEGCLLKRSCFHQSSNATSAVRVSLKFNEAGAIDGIHMREMSK